MKNDRQNKILEIITKENTADVRKLSDILGVSQVTIRKDLSELEGKGLIRREHGYASLKSIDDINGRLAYHYENKKRIARAAAGRVSDGDCIMIESGSCCALLAEILTETRRDLTIITNSAFIAEYIRGKSDFNIVLLGGRYQQNARIMVGPLVRLCAENYFAGYFFIGTDGYSEEHGFTNNNEERAQAVRDMARQSARVAVLTESEKLASAGRVPLNICGGNVSVITDNKISLKMRQCLDRKGFEVILAGKGEL